MHNPVLYGISAVKNTLFISLLSLLILIIFNPANASLNGNDPLSREYSPESLTSFVKYLIDNAEFYRAHAELDRLTSYYPEYITPLCYNITSSYLLFKSGRYNDILAKDMVNKDNSSLCAINIFRIDSLIKTGIYNDQLMDELFEYQHCFEGEYSDLYKKREMYYAILKSFNDETDLIQTDNNKYHDSCVYAQNLSQEKKSPLLGAVAGIIPGMGYVYAGETGTGVLAFIVIAAGSAITWGAHVNKIEPLAAISGAATFFMYSGSIAGGYMQAIKFNRGLSEKLVVRLDRDFLLDRDRDDLYIKCGIESNVR